MMLGGALVNLPVHAERLVVEHLETVHADIARPRDGIAREHHGKRDVAPGVSRPAADDGHRGERRPVRLDHFLAGGGAHALGAGLGDVEQVAELSELVEERARHPEVEELRHPCGQLVEPLDAKRRRHALGRAEGVDEHRRREPLHVLEEQRQVLLGGSLRDAVGDLGDLEVARDRCRHAAKLTALVEVRDELPEVGEGHGYGPITRESRRRGRR